MEQTNHFRSFCPSINEFFSNYVAARIDFQIKVSRLSLYERHKLSFTFIIISSALLFKFGNETVDIINCAK